MKTLFKYCFVSVFLLVVACENREWNNPYDPDCPKEIFTPTNFTATQEGEQVILSWNQSNSNISGFKIERQVENENFSSIASPGKNENSATSTISAGGKVHTYKLYASAGNNKSNEVSTTITPVLKAAITTKAVTGITATSAISGGTIPDDGGGAVNARGVVWNKTGTPTLEINAGKTTDGNGKGSFTSELTGLEENTNYFVKAYATNSKGTNYGDVQTFSTLEITLPEVTTAAIINITANSARSGGEVISDGNSPVTLRGIVWNSIGTPTLENFEGKTENGSGTGSFISELTGLEEGTDYFVRAYAVNSQGITYGIQVSFTAEIIEENETGTFTDSRDGNVYKWAKIGEQIWMAENLAYLPNVSPPSVGSDNEPYYYVFGYFGDNVNAAKATSNYNTHGVLYNRYAAQNACPPGWHLPTDEEWEQLAQFISDDNGGYHKSNSTWYDVGTHLKNETGWLNNHNGTNDYAFSGLPSGFFKNGYFANMEYNSYWWSYTIPESGWGYCRGLNEDNRFSRYGSKFSDGLSIRCIRD